MGKRLTKEELLYRLNEGDLKQYFDKYKDENDFIQVYHDGEQWLIEFKCHFCNQLYQRTIHKLKRGDQCLTSECKVRRQKQTNLLLHGNENYNNIEQMKQTKLERYGDTFGHRDKISNTWNNRSDTEKQRITQMRVNTKRQRYGDSLCTNIEQEKEQWRLSMQGKNQTMSNWEKEAYDKLVTKFNKVYYNYYDKSRYPYLCDFYIEDIDMFIELNYHWSHGGEPYNATKSQLDLVNEWRNKGWYGNIKTWTVKDVQKRSFAKSNNLNYKEFFTRSSFNKWYKSI